MLAFVSSFSSIAFLRGAERLGKTIRSSSRDILISSYSKKNNHGKTFGFHKMMDIAVELTGALILLFIFMFFTKNENIIKDIFIWTIIPGVIASIIVMFFIKDVPKTVEKKR